MSDEYETVWDGAIRKQVESVTVTMYDLRTFTVQRVIASGDALLPPRSTNSEWRDREATDAHIDGHKGKSRPRMAPAQLDAIARLWVDGWKVRSIALRLKLPYSTVQAFTARRYAQRRMKQGAAA